MDKPSPSELDAAIALAISEYAEAGIKLDEDAVREALADTNDPLGRLDDLRALKDD